MNKMPLPKIIIIYTDFLELFALGSGLWGIFQPMQMFENMSITLEGTAKEVFLTIYYLSKRL